jgi:alcohol dehydrogenase class IV
MDINQLKTFNLAAPEILFGMGSIAELGKRVKSLGAEKVMIVTDEGVVGAGILDRVRGFLEKSDIACDVFNKVQKEPSIENVEIAFQEASKGDYQALIGLGGGSPIDVAKMVSILLKHGGDVRNYMARPKSGAGDSYNHDTHDRWYRIRGEQVCDLRQQPDKNQAWRSQSSSHR